MGVVKRIYKNMMFLGSAEIISKALQFVLMVYAARLLDQSSFGKFSFALSLSFIAIIFADLGINTLLIREIARKKNLVNKYFINAFLVKLLFAFVAYVFIIIFLNVLNYPEETRYVVYLIWIFMIISTFTDLFYSIFRAFERMIFDSIIKILRMVILTTIGLYVLFKYQDVVLFSMIFIFVEVLMLVIAYFIGTKKFIKIEWVVDIKFIKNLVKKSLPFGLAFAFSTIYFYIDSIMLSKMRGDVEVAIYSVAFNLALALLFIPAVYTNAIYPVMSRYYKSSKSNLILIYKKSFNYLFIIGLPISVGLYLLADRIIIFFYGTEYISSIIALKIISWFLFIKFLNYLIGYVLSSINQQNKRMLSQGSTAIFNIVLNLLLIPVMGFVGAAIATFITEIFLFILYFRYVSKYLCTFNFLRILGKPIIAVIVMGMFIEFTSFRLFIIIPLSALVYFVVIFKLKTFKKDDYEILNKIIKKQA